MKSIILYTFAIFILKLYSHLFVEDDSHSEPYKVRIGSFGHVEFEPDGIMRNTAHGKVEDMMYLL